jgi:hypothetical protein
MLQEEEHVSVLGVICLGGFRSWNGGIGWNSWGKVRGLLSF